MGNISTDTVFHFTSKANLFGILKDNFYPKYRLETVHLFSTSEEIAIPMVSFCDIPLSQIKEHVEDYGSYGIGMTKTWAYKNRLNPVIYLKKDSTLSKNLKDIFESTGILTKIYKKYKKEIEDNKKTPSSQQSNLMLAYAYGYKQSGLLHSQGTAEMETGNRQLLSTIISIYRFICYVKEYNGFSKRRKKKVFYNEKEWRYVPQNGDFLFKNEIDTQEKMEEENLKIQEAKLSFNPKDIKYIIVKKDTEILEIIKELEQIKGSKYPANTIKKLTSRIITYEQIKNDF
jgi:hypothetical protein